LKCTDPSKFSNQYIFNDRAPLYEVEVLEYHADILSHFPYSAAVAAGNMQWIAVAIEYHFATIRNCQAVQAPQQDRFSSAAKTEYRHELAPFDTEIYITQQ